MRVFLATAAAVAATLASPTSAHPHHEHRAVSSGRALDERYLLRGLKADSMTMSSMSSSMDSSMTMSSMGSGSGSSSSSTEYTCPVCGMSTTGMGYDNHNYVELANGQRVYTCGMDAYTHDDYSFSVTDTSYLAANMAEFVTNTSSCEDSCPECADGVADPVSGAAITADSFQLVCLEHGQKIYFASAATKAVYLGNLTSEVRYLVEEIICSSETCSDATEITSLSAAAADADLTSALLSGRAVGSSSAAGSVGSAGSSSSSNGALSAHQPALLATALAGAAALVSAFSF